MTGQLDDPARATLAVNDAFCDLGNETFESEGATFVRNREVPDIWDANHVSRITASTPVEIDRLLERVEREFDGFRHRQFWLDFTTPPAVEARLALEGYRQSETLFMLLEGDLAGPAARHEIKQVETEADWEAYAALHDMDWREYTARMPEESGFDEETAIQMIRSRRGKSPPVRIWMAYVDGEPRAYASSWGGVNGVGQVEDVFTHPRFRHRGLATALIRHGVAEARREGGGPMVIAADPKDTPKLMYAAMGFRPVAVKREYRKDLGSS